MNYLLIFILLLVPANLEAKQRSDIFEASNYLSASGVNSRITSQNTDEYLDFSTDDYAEFQGAGGSDNTDLRIDLDGTMPVLDSPTDSLIGFLDGVQLGQAGTDGQLVFYNELGATDYTVTMNLSGSQGANITYTLPPTDGAADEFLKTDGSGVLTWVAVSGVTASSGDVTAVGDCTSGACFGSGGSGNTLTLNSDYIELDGTEDIKLSTATANTFVLSSDTGVTQMDIPFTVGLQNSETIYNTTDGTVCLSADNGNAEDICFNLSGASNSVTASSTTGVTNLVWGATTLAGASNSPMVTMSGTFGGIGLSVSKTLTSGSDSSVIGVSSSVTKSISGSSNAITALRGSSTFSNTSSTTQDNAYGVFGTGTKSGASSTLTNFYGVYGQKATVSSGTVTRNYGLGVEGAGYVAPQSAAPSSPREGDFYTDSDSHEFCYYNGSSWVGLVAGGACA